MTETHELHIPDDRRYATDHEWAKTEGERVRVGISDFAQSELGDVVFVELPEVGASFERGQVFGTVESVKAVSELYMPFAGEVVEVNEALEDAPELVNDSPYDEGWMILARPSAPVELEDLLTAEVYRAGLASEV